MRERCSPCLYNLILFLQCCRDCLVRYVQSVRHAPSTVAAADAATATATSAVFANGGGCAAAFKFVAAAVAVYDAAA